MRPHKLTMKAFGPFAKQTIVDFDAMGDTIYLISGDTGSGKTTIFDGIIYALYGTASGGARSGLGTEAFHSDYAKDGNHRDEMSVEFVFSNAGKTYTAARKMYWGKKGDSKTVSRESTLSEGGNTIVHSKGKEERDEVTAKVTEILGLDADQFRRIIMLAQGEFQKFLTAGSGERGEILGKLYDNRRHQDFQLRLKAAADLLKKQDTEAVREGTVRLQSFHFPKDCSEEERAAVAVDHPSLLSVIGSMISRMETDLEKMQNGIRDRDEEQKKLDKQKTLGERNNRLLDDLAEKKNQQADLNKREKEIGDLKKLTDLAENAGKVLPYEEAVRQAAADLENVLKRIRQLEEEKDRLTQQAKELEAGSRAVEENNTPRITALQEQQEAVRNILHFYDDLRTSLDVQKDRTQDLKNADDKVAAAKKRLEGLQSRQGELEKELQRLASAGEAAVSIAGRTVDDLAGRSTELEELRVSTGLVKQLEKEEKNLKDARGKAADAELAAQREHYRLNEAFLMGQAGVLARDLREKLKTEKEVTCPVCGSVHTIADEGSFAEWHKEIPTKKAVDNAYTAWEKAHRDREKAEAAHTEKQNTLSAQKEAALQKAKKLIGLSDWEDLAKGEALSAAIDECGKQLAAAQSALQQAEADRKAKDRASSEKEKVDGAVSAAEEALKAAEQVRTGALAAKAAADEAVSGWRKQLEGQPEDKAAALKLMEAKKREAALLQKQIDDAKEKHAACLQRLASNKGNLEAAGLEQEERKKAAARAAETFDAALTQWSFTDSEAYHSALCPEGRLLDKRELGSWIARRKKEIEDFDKARQELEVSIRQLMESTKGLERVDLTQIEKQIGDLSEILDAMREGEKNLSVDVRTDQEILGDLREIEERRTGYRKAYEKLVPLADTANSNYAFSRYVLSGFFHRIVDQANIHLDTLTDGEYRLVPKETGDGRRNIGLELKVLNTITNLERDTASLSGGQLFEASLSLALGLSDIVQMESTSRIRIDSMFIDEGFGSLDGGRLDKAISVLDHLSGGKRQIGIISHVARLDECLPRKIHVIAGNRGSEVRIETDT